MKKFHWMLASLAVVCASCHSSADWKERPDDGVYRMTKLTGSDGTEVTPPPFDQYKVYRDSTLYKLFLNGELTPEKGVVGFEYTTSEQVDYLTEAPEDMKDSEEYFDMSPFPKMYEITDKGFQFKWFNNMSFYRLFPIGTWVTETFEKGKTSETARLFLETLRTQPDAANPLLGVWRLIDVAEIDKDGKTKHQAVSQYYYKIYGKEASILTQHNLEMFSRIGISPQHFSINLKVENNPEIPAPYKNYPLIVLDGEILHVDLSSINIDDLYFKDSDQWGLGELLGLEQEDVAGFKLLPEDDAAKKYGEPGRNGVVEIYTWRSYAPMLPTDFRITGEMRSTRYEDANTAIEGTTPCIISTENDLMFLTYTPQGGKPLTETWVRVKDRFVLDFLARMGQE